jgi:YVTN family beta-propeller protein
VAVAVNPKDNHVYVVNVGNGTVDVIRGLEPLGTVDLTQADRPATGCNGRTAYGRCLTAVGILPAINAAYVTEWVFDVAHVISGTTVMDWVYAGRGPAGVLAAGSEDSVYALDKWTAGVTLIESARDLAFVSLPGCQPEAGLIVPGTRTAYVAGGTCNTLAVITGSTKTADIRVGTYPNAVAYNSTNGWVYAVNSGSTPATVSVISATQVVATVTVGTSSTLLGVDSYWGIERNGSNHIVAVGSQGLVYVANWGSGSVSVISGTHKITDVVVGLNPNAIAFDPVSNLVYVANTGSDSVAVICGTALFHSVPVGDYPFDLAVNPATGYVYVVNREADTLSVLRNGIVVATLPLPVSSLVAMATPSARPGMAAPEGSLGARAWLPIVQQASCIAP